MKNSRIVAKCNGAEYPMLAFDGTGPFFSWKIIGENAASINQGAYELEVSEKSEFAEKVWDSGRVHSARQYMVEYEGPRPEPLKRYWYRVSLWDEEGTPLGSSTPQWFEPGLPDASCWHGKWIGGAGQLRSTFRAKKTVKEARVYVACVGYFELFLNGSRVGDAVLNPSHTDIRKRIEYCGYDVTKQLETNTAICLTLGRGMLEEMPYYLEKPYALLQLYVFYEDGSVDECVTDENWKMADGAIRHTSLYDGDTIDARMETAGWLAPGYDDSGWEQARVFETPQAVLSPQQLPPIRIKYERKPVKVVRISDTIQVIHFEKHITGWLQLRVKGEPGTQLHLRYAAVLFQNGRANQLPLRTAECTDHFILSGREDVFEPRFTYHGFQYVEVENYPGDISPEDVVAKELYTDLEQTGEFACSSEAVNAVHDMMQRTLRQCIHGIPEDNCERDERKGWWGDAHIVCETNMANFDCHWFYRKWFHDVLDTIDGETGIPLANQSPEWSKGLMCVYFYAPFEIAWQVYRYYDDDTLIREGYDKLKKLFRYLESLEDENGVFTDIAVIDGCFPFDNTFDDWLCIERTRDVQLMNMMHINGIRVFREMAKLAGDTQEAERLEGRDARLAERFNEMFLSEDPVAPDNGWYGYTCDISQTGQAMPLWLDIVPEKVRDLAIENLVYDLQEKRGETQLTTGFYGTKYLFEVLPVIGRNDIGVELFERTRYPSWGFMLRCGYNTCWERWQRMEGLEMNSHCQAAFCAADEWLYKGLAGISQEGFDEAGHRVFAVHPYFPKHFGWLRTKQDTPWGQISCSWEKKDGKILLDLVIPPNTVGELRLGESARHLRAGAHHFEF